MKSRDLMIGDWVTFNHLYDGVNHKVMTKIVIIGGQNILTEYGQSNGDNLQPIKLTEEILEKNGFKEDSETNGIYWRPDCRKFCIVKELDTWYFAFRVLGKTVDKSSGYICILECNYVHKLQHILKDLEIEKEIVL